MQHSKKKNLRWGYNIPVFKPLPCQDANDKICNCLWGSEPSCSPHLPERQYQHGYPQQGDAPPLHFRAVFCPIGCKKSRLIRNRTPQPGFVSVTQLNNLPEKWLGLIYLKLLSRRRWRCFMVHLRGLRLFSTTRIFNDEFGQQCVRRLAVRMLYRRFWIFSLKQGGNVSADVFLEDLNRKGQHWMHLMVFSVMVSERNRNHIV